MHPNPDVIIITNWHSDLNIVSVSDTIIVSDVNPITNQHPNCNGFFNDHCDPNTITDMHRYSNPHCFHHTKSYRNAVVDVIVHCYRYPLLYIDTNRLPDIISNANTIRHVVTNDGLVTHMHNFPNSNRNTLSYIYFKFIRHTITDADKHTILNINSITFTDSHQHYNYIAHTNCDSNSKLRFHTDQYFLAHKGANINRKQHTN
mmetsp:Transcript_99922/g.172337  ORF Transcript_99922/g.172337 Transcript_99922/m.172337 type:complete len:203 (-) Transcript_99922:1121-1729(-)